MLQKQDLEDSEYTRDQTSIIVENLITPETLFMFRIAFPCWFLHGEPPSLLLKKAQQGDLTALENILRLDAIVQFDPKIQNITQSYYLSENKYKFEKINSAIKSSIKATITLQRIKFMMAGFISVLSQGFQQRLNEPEIRKLFNAIVIDKQIDDAIDSDIPDSPESFSKAIQRDRKFWLPLLTKPDIK